MINKQVASQTPNFNLELKLKGFKVYEIDSEANSGHTYSRKDFYKINLTTGKFIFHFADNSLVTDEVFLFFGNPHTPYSYEAVSSKFSGYTCVFTEDFLKLGGCSESLLQSPLFKIGGTPLLELNELQKEFIICVFKRMLAEQENDYAFKDELIRNYITLIICEAFKMQLLENHSQTNALKEIHPNP